MNLQEYQARARATAIYPRQGNNIEYPMVGLCEEVGEIGDQVDEIHTHDGSVVRLARREKIKLECGDVLWYFGSFLDEAKLTFSEVALGHQDMTVYQLAIAETKEEYVGRIGERTFIKLVKDMGRLAGHIKRVNRDDNSILTDARRVSVKACSVDFLKSYTLFALDMNLLLSGIAEANLLKIDSRKTRGVLQGSGDNR